MALEVVCDSRNCFAWSGGRGCGVRLNRKRISEHAATPGEIFTTRRKRSAPRTLVVFHPDIYFKPRRFSWRECQGPSLVQRGAAELQCFGTPRYIPLHHVRLLLSFRNVCYRLKQSCCPHIKMGMLFLILEVHHRRHRSFPRNLIASSVNGRNP